MTTLEIIRATQIKAAAVKAAAKLLQEKYPDLLEAESEIAKFVELMVN
jgi:ribosomal protein S17E